MTWILAGLLAVHGAIHLMGVAKGFGLAELSELTRPIGRGMGSAWLLAAVLLLAAAGLLLAGSRGWWAVALAAAVVSQVVIVTSWADARFGTVANVLIAAAAIHGLASQGPMSLRDEYRREVAARLESPPTTAVLTEDDLAPLPAPVQQYVRQSGAVGQPRVRHFQARWRGRIRGTAGEPWMSFTAEQHNFLDEPARFFFMDAVRGGLPVDVYHAFSGGAAGMRVRLLSLVPLVRASGPEATRAETVTLLNDLCLLAPGALVDPAIRWEAVDDRTARASYTVGENTIDATLIFNDAGELVDFTSDDRLAVSADGRTWTRQRWSTPVGEYREFGPLRLMSHGTGRWHPPEGAFDYIELELLNLRTNGPLP